MKFTAANWAATLVLAGAIGCAPAAWAGTIYFHFSAPNSITATGTFTTQAGPGDAEEITGVSGVFSDTKANYTGTIAGLVSPVTYVSTTGSEEFTSAGNSYDDLWYPNGDSPQLCPGTYPFDGGLLDIFGVAFNLTGTGASAGQNDIGLLWSNGYDSDPNYIYAAGLTNASAALDLPTNDLGIPGELGSLSTVPEPGTVVLFGFGVLLFGLLVARERKRNPRAASVVGA